MSCNAPDLDLQCWWKTKEININILIVKGGGLSPFSPPPGCTFGGTWQERSTLLLSGAGLGWLFASSSPVRASKQAQECDMWYEVFAKLTWNVQITWKGKPKQTSSFSYPLIHQAVGQSPEPAETNLNDFVNKNQCMRLHYSVTVSAGGSKILTGVRSKQTRSKQTIHNRPLKTDHVHNRPIHNRPVHNRLRSQQTTFTTDHVHNRPVHNRPVHNRPHS